MIMIFFDVCGILISVFPSLQAFLYQFYASSWLQAAESRSFSEKAIRNYTLTPRPRPPRSLQDPRRKISIYLGRYAFAYTCIYRIEGFFRGRNFREFRVSVAICEFSPRKSIFKQLVTALVNWVTANSLCENVFSSNSRKVFSRENPRYIP